MQRGEALAEVGVQGAAGGRLPRAERPLAVAAAHAGKLPALLLENAPARALLPHGQPPRPARELVLEPRPEHDLEHGEGTRQEEGRAWARGRGQAWQREGRGQGEDGC